MTLTAGYATRELQAAAAALTAGHFADPNDGNRSRPMPGSWLPRTPVLRVRATHAGAGASTLALALADTAARSATVHLVDAAAPAWSGLTGATATELGARDGWRRGRRNPRLVVDRLDRPAATPAEVPVPREHVCALIVLDVGWSARELSGHPGWLTTTPVDVDLLVTRASAAALRQTETVLQMTRPGPRMLLVLGTRRWHGPEFTAAGTRLRELRDADALHFAPLLPRRSLTGLGPDPLPRPLLSTAQRLLARLGTQTSLPTDPAVDPPTEER